MQRVVLAKWMATNPHVLILDSPTVGVDISAKDGIYEIIRRLAREGVAVLMISDEIPEVLYHSHRVLVMRQGRLTIDIPAENTSEDAFIWQSLDSIGAGRGANPHDLAVGGF